MASVRIKRTLLLAKMEEALEKQAQERARFDNASKTSEVKRLEQRIAGLQSDILNCRKALREAKKRQGNADPVQPYRDFLKDSWLAREIRILDMSDEEFVRVGLSSDWARYL